jgi:preprotein translocase subunit SecE
MGALTEQGTPTRAQRTAPQKKEERTTIAQYFREVRAEMRKVAWPTWEEVRRYSAIVLVTVLFVMALVGGLDILFGFFSDWLYHN